MDSLTAHYLARELDARWRGRRVSGCVLDRERRRVLLGVEGAWVCFDLSAPDVPVHEALPPGAGGLMEGWTVEGVHAPEDDRRLVVELSRPGRFKGSRERRATLEVSAVPSARGAVLRDAGGARLASVGAKLPQRAEPRHVLDLEAVATAARAGDAAALLTGRWMSPTVAQWIASDPERATERYQLVVGGGEAEPARCGGAIVPFPMCPDAERVASLVAPMPRAEEAPTGADTDRVARTRRRMQAELDRARAAPQLRQLADALAALGDEPAPEAVRLADGAEVAVPDRRPGESAVQAAERLYGEVRSMERALEKLPARIAALGAGDGTPPRALQRARREPARATRPTPERRFRTYRSSGGLEIWVGRGAASNDALTFHAADPDDVWLHARGAAGAHVVLRWSRDEPPPARDLEEAALLAAWHSKARGSAVVPVDWTRRKYVRKPRGAPAGLVLVQRAATVFVRPDPAVERSLKDER
jgi:hypothetical protein